MNRAEHRLTHIGSTCTVLAYDPSPPFPRGQPPSTLNRQPLAAPKQSDGGPTLNSTSALLSGRAIRIPVPKPTDGHNRCDLKPGTPETIGKAPSLVSRLRSPTPQVVYMGMRRFESPKPFPKPVIVDIRGWAGQGKQALSTPLQHPLRVRS